MLVGGSEPICLLVAVSLYACWRQWVCMLVGSSGSICLLQLVQVRQIETDEFIDPNDPMYARWKTKVHPETPVKYHPDSLLPQPVKGKTFERLPLRLMLEADTTYTFCTCGYSKQQPFCDASHKSPHFMSTRPHHLKYRPITFTVKETKEYWLCMCKQSDNRPFCDGSHKKIEDPSAPKDK
ncbi:unnamed protein product [Candidula unifasciata]|uniref:Iron-binding zinc finger CDGSH type domain-containing protein n=1 Tax=Candidula unifasciata TaxID=100452 RepID=A0A8S3YSC9_9EUPU|nr:unnamed protein product [Candidula unifasciata]